MAFYGSLGEVNFDNLDVSITDTAVDVFVYDTSKDSDGGAWRKRTQHTSWYNETLGTATRGSRKEFPAVAVIVSTLTKVTIYDGDDPDLPMWMVFQSSGYGVSGVYMFNAGNVVNSSVYALNGILVGGQYQSSDHYGSPIINFISEKVVRMDPQPSEGGLWLGNIATRNTTTGYASQASSGQGYLIIDSRINDVAMTVLPNAPIDSATGLPIPTIAVATDGGISVIKDNGTVINGGDTIAIPKIHISKENRLYYTFVGYSQTREVFGPNSWTSSGFLGSHQMTGTSSYPTLPTGSGNGINITTGAYGKNAGLFLHDPDPVDIPSDPDNNNGMVAYIASDYNTGWMHGDIKGAFLSDTDTTNVTSNELVPNSDFLSDLGWNLVSGYTISGGLLSDGSTSEPTALSGSGFYLSTGTYTLSYQASGSGGSPTVFVNRSSDNVYIKSLQVSSDPFDGVMTTSFTVSTAGNHYMSVSGTNFIGSYDYISVIAGTGTRTYASEEDRSVNNNGLQVYGTVTKTPVATGADLVDYSGWSSSNYMDNTSYAVNFGNPVTISIVFWQKITDIADYSYGVSFSHGNTVKGGISNGASASSYPGQGYFNMGSQTLYTGSRVDDGNWHCLVGTISGTAKKFYLDGREVESATINNHDMSGISRIHVGSYGITHAYAHRGSLALLRVSKSVPSPEQIKKMYEDEKFLFQENAKVTLHGSSDAVTALAYDEDTDLLHVGTSAGRSEFQGLRRINNTTDAVTTAISASNGLVAEQ